MSDPVEHRTAYDYAATKRRGAVTTGGGGGGCGGGWVDESDLYAMVSELLWKATIRSLFGSTFDRHDTAVRHCLSLIFHCLSAAFSLPFLDLSLQPFDRQGTAASAGDGSGASDEDAGLTQARADFKRFDDCFPMLAGGLPHALLPGCSGALERLRAAFACGPVLPGGDASELLQVTTLPSPCVLNCFLL